MLALSDESPSSSLEQVMWSMINLVKSVNSYFTDELKIKD